MTFRQRTQGNDRMSCTNIRKASSPGGLDHDHLNWMCQHVIFSSSAVASQPLMIVPPGIHTLCNPLPHCTRIVLLPVKYGSSALSILGSPSLPPHSPSFWDHLGQGRQGASCHVWAALWKGTDQCCWEHNVTPQCIRCSLELLWV